MRRAFNNPVGRRSRLAALAAESATSTRPARRLARLLGLVLVAAVLVLWAGPALGQNTLTFSATHTGSATVTDGRIQLVEGGAATTFQIALPDDFLTTLKAAHPEAGNTGARFGALLYILRDSADVTWDTTSGTTHKDRTAEYTISYNGTEIQPRYSSMSSSLPERTWVYIPLTGTPPGSTSSYANVDDFAAASFPISFTIKAESDTTYVENESIRVRGRFILSGSSATPSFSTVRWNTDDLTFDLVEGALPDPTGKPTTPADLTATAGKGAVTLTWDPVDATSSNTNLVNDVQITKHQVRQTTDNDITDETWTDIPNSAYRGVNATTHTIGSLTAGTTYTFQVRAVNGCTTSAGCGESDPAPAVMATPDADALAQPTGLMATAGNTEVTLTWTDPGDASIAYYQYAEKVGSAAFGVWTEIPGSSATTTSHRFTELSNGTAYSYRIRARTNVNASPTSDLVTATPRGAPPAAPVLTATPRHGGVTLSWRNPVDASLQRYEYQYKIGNGVYQPWQVARARTEEQCGRSTSGVCGPPYLDTSGATLQFAVGGLANDTPHTFRIRALNADGTATSNEATATPVAAVPAKPTGLTTRLNSSGNRRILEWDPAADASILRYEYTVDEGRTWSLLSSIATASSHALPEDQFLSGYTVRIRAVNAAGPGPASEPAVEEEADPPVVNRGLASGVRVEWNQTTKKATLVWNHSTNARLRWWHVLFQRSGVHAWNKTLPIGTIRYEIPAEFDGGDTISVWIIGCSTTRVCYFQYELLSSNQRNLVVGVPERPTGFSATAGDAQIALTWDDPMDSSITKYQHELNRSSVVVDIPDGDDADTNPGNETSYTVTMFGGDNLVNGNTYNVRLRAVNANGAGPWTTWLQQGEFLTPQAPGTPARPSGLVKLRHSIGGQLNTWDDPQDPSITVYQKYDRGTWEDIPGSDATTTGYEGDLDRLRAVNAKGAGLWAAPTTVYSPAPAQPTGLRAAPGNGRVTLTWDDPGKDVYIASYRYTADGGDTWTAIPDSNTTLEGHVTRYTVQNLTNGQTHTFAIQAENDEGTSPVSAAVTARPRGAAPGKPSGLSAAPGNTEATLTWDDPHDASITRYQVKQDSAAWADISGSDAGTTSHTVGSLGNGAAYTFQIRAVNDHDGDNTDDPGPASDGVTVTPGVPTAPASLVAAPGDTQVTLTWTAPASDNGSAVTGYEYTSNADAATPAWTDVPDSGSDGRADETEYTVTGLVNNTSYAFAVRAENANGQGAATRTLRAVPAHPDAPQRPAGLKANPGHQEVWLTWSPPGNPNHPVTSYEYRQSTDGGTNWSPDWTAIPGSGADTAEHRLTGLANGTTYTFELRALKGSTAGPAARGQATPSLAAADAVIDHRSSGQLTSPTGSMYTVTQLSPPAGLKWRIIVPGTTEIGGRTFTVRSLQGTTPETSSRYAFTSTGQEGLDIVVHPPLAGQARVCLEPTPLLRREAGSRPLRVLRYSGTGWTPLPTTTDGGMLCGTTSGFSAFVLGYATARPGGPPDGPSGPNAAPEAAEPLPPQTVAAGETSEPLDLAPYFRDPDGDPLTFAAVSDDASVLIVDLPRGSSQLTLRGVAAGAAVVTVTARDPGGAEASQQMTVTVGSAGPNVAPEVVQRLPPQTVPTGETSELLELTRYFRDPDGDPLTFAAVSDNTGVVVAFLPRGSVRLTLRGVRAGEAVVTVTARDPGGAEASQSVAVTVRPNAAPEVAQRLVPQRVRAGDTSEPIDLAPYFRDPDGDPLTFAAVSHDPAVAIAEVTGDNQLTLRGVAAGEAGVIVTARDSIGAEASQPVTVTVWTNAAPEVAQPLEPQTLLAGTPSEPLDLTPYFHDPDGDPLAYAAVSDNAAVAIAEVTGGDQLTVRGVAAGEAVVTVTARDPIGAEASQTMTLTVRTNAAPEVAQPLPPQTLLIGTESEPLDLAAYFHDPDGDPLTYAAVSDSAGVATAEVAEGGNLLTLRAVAPGTAVVVVTARDPWAGEASQSVTVTVTAADPEWVKAWVARFGRTVSGHVLDGVQERLRAAPRQGFQASLAGHQLGGISEEASRELGNWQLGGPAAFQRDLELFAGRTDEQMSHGARQQGSTARDLFTSSAFSLTVGNPEEDAGGGFGAVWGRGAVSRFDGQDGPLSLAGEVATGMVGFDWISGRLRTGLALAMSRGSGGYNAAAHRGDIESKLTGLFPWVGYDFTDRVSVWAAAGYGAGVLTLTPESEEALTAELGLSMVAAGARAELLKLRQLGGVVLALETDTRLTRTTTGAIAGLDATEASVWQRRLGLEGSRPVALGGRLSLRPSFEVGLRYDGGDAENGAGMDVGAGLGFADSGTGLAVDVHVRTLLVHQAEGFSERGVALSLSYDPTPSTPLGLTARMAPEWGGQAQSGAAALWGRETMAGMAHGGPAQGYRLNGEVGYGLPVGARFVGTPRVGFSTSEHSRDYRVGYGLGVLERGSLQVDVGIDALRSESPMQGASNAVRGQASLGW